MKYYRRRELRPKHAAHSLPLRRSILFSGKMPTAILCQRERLRATGINCSIKPLVSPSPGAFQLWVRWRFFSWWTRLSACASRPKTKLQASTSRNMGKKATTLAPNQTCCHSDGTGSPRTGLRPWGNDVNGLLFGISTTFGKSAETDSPPIVVDLWDSGFTST